MVLCFHSRRSQKKIPVWWQVYLQHLNLPHPETKWWVISDNCFVPKLSSWAPLPDACQKLTTYTCNIGCNIAWCGWNPNPYTASCAGRVQWYMHAPIIFAWHMAKFSATVSIDLKRLLISQFLIFKNKRIYCISVDCAAIIPVGN